MKRSFDKVQQTVNSFIKLYKKSLQDVDVDQREYEVFYENFDKEGSLGSLEIDRVTEGPQKHFHNLSFDLCFRGLTILKAFIIIRHFFHELFR